MSLNNSTMPASNLSHGTTNTTGSGPRVLSSDHEFSGEKDAAYWRTQMVVVEVVLKEATSVTTLLAMNSYIFKSVLMAILIELLWPFRMAISTDLK